MGLGAWLKAARVSAKMTQQEVADCIGLKDKSYIGLVENETPHHGTGLPRRPSIDVIKKWASCVGKDEAEALHIAAGLAQPESSPLKMAVAEGGESKRRGIVITPPAPMTRELFLEEMERLGVDDFNPVKGWKKLTPADMEEIIKVARREAHAAARSAAQVMIEQKLKHL